MGNEFSNLDDISTCCNGSRQAKRGAKGMEFTIPDPAADRQRLFNLVESGQHMMLDAFLQRKFGMIDINAVNEKGETSLHVAAKLGYLGCCKSLVANGANVVLQDWAGKTPVDVARQSNHSFCEAFLKARLEAVQAETREKHEHTSQLSSARPQNSASPNSTPRREEHDEEEVTPAVTLYDYTANAGAPFPPDKRMEMSISEGEKLVLLEAREDGWALVRRKHGKTEGYVPGNYISIDGGHPLFDDHGKTTGHHGSHGHKFKHLTGVGHHVAHQHGARHVHGMYK